MKTVTLELNPAELSLLREAMSTTFHPDRHTTIVWEQEDGSRSQTNSLALMSKLDAASKK